MFVDALDGAVLRQGDILRSIPFPIVSSAELSFLGTLHAVGADGRPELRASEITLREQPAWTCQLRVRIGFACVISQCCDLEPRNGKVTSTIALARLVDPPKSTRSDREKRESLQANKFPLNPDDPGYLQYFYVPQHDRLDGRDWVVDYTQVTSIPATEFPAVLANKVLQMTDDSRVRFKVKLAAALGRLTEEEENSNHPWLRETPTDVSQETAPAGESASPNDATQNLASDAHEQR
jgi:hypothetical protein